MQARLAIFPLFGLVPIVASYPIACSNKCMPVLFLDRFSPPTVEGPFIKRMTQEIVPFEEEPSSSHLHSPPLSPLQHRGRTLSSDDSSHSVTVAATPQGSPHASPSPASDGPLTMSTSRRTPHAAHVSNLNRIANAASLLPTPLDTSAHLPTLQPDQGIHAPRDPHANLNDHSFLGKSRLHMAQFRANVARQAGTEETADDFIKYYARVARQESALALDSSRSVFTGRAPRYSGEERAGTRISRGPQALTSLRLMGRAAKSGVKAAGVAGGSIPISLISKFWNTLCATTHLAAATGYRVLHHAQLPRRRRPSTAPDPSRNGSGAWRRRPSALR